MIDIKEKREDKEDEEGQMFTCEKMKKAKFTAYKDFKKKCHEVGEKTWDNLPLPISSLSETNWIMRQSKFLSTKRKNLFQGLFLATGLYAYLRQINSSMT